MAEALPDYFSLFHFERHFAIDSAELTRRYRDIQNEIHPDRYAGQSAQAQRLAVQKAAYVNEAYQCLKQPLARAKYLLAVLQPALADVQATLDAGFLMEQMDLREQLEQQSHSGEALDTFCDAAATRCRQVQQDFAAAIESKQFERANTALAKWQFIDKLLREAQAARDTHD